MTTEATSPVSVRALVYLAFTIDYGVEAYVVAEPGRVGALGPRLIFFTDVEYLTALDDTESWSVRWKSLANALAEVQKMSGDDDAEYEINGDGTAQRDGDKFYLLMPCGDEHTASLETVAAIVEYYRPKP